MKASLRKCTIYFNHPPSIRAEIRAFTLDMGDRRAQVAANEVLQDFNIGILTKIFMTALRFNMQDHIDFQHVVMKDKKMIIEMSPAFFTMVRERKLKHVLGCELS